MKISLTLAPHEAEMLQRAANITQGKTMVGGLNISEGVSRTDVQHRAWLAKNAIYVVARAVIKDGYLALPPAADMRWETPEETAVRLGKKDGGGGDDPEIFVTRY